jgi:hypothetical protein
MPEQEQPEEEEKEEAEEKEEEPESGLGDELLDRLARPTLSDARTNATRLGGGPDDPAFLASDVTLELEFPVARAEVTADALRIRDRYWRLAVGLSPRRRQTRPAAGRLRRPPRKRRRGGAASHRGRGRVRATPDLPGEANQQGAQDDGPRTCDRANLGGITAYG